MTNTTSLYDHFRFVYVKLSHLDSFEVLNGLIRMVNVRVMFCGIDTRRFFSSSVPFFSFGEVLIKDIVISGS